LRNLTRFFAFLAALLFIVVLPLSLFSFNVGRVLYNRPLLKTVLTDAVTDSELVPAALAWFTEEVSAGLPLTEVAQQDLTAVLLSLTQEGWAAIRAEVLSDDILAGWTSSIVDGFYDWLDSDEPLPNFTLDMQSFKARLHSDFGLRAIEIAYNALPLCGNEQVEEFKSQLANAVPGLNVYYPPCQFPDTFKDDQLTDYLNSLTDVVKLIPDRYAVQLQETPDASEGWPVLKTYLRTFRVTYWMGLVVAVLLWGIIALLVIRTPRGMARWGGIPLALAGLAAILLSWLPGAFVAGWLLGGPLQATSPQLREEIRLVISQLTQEMFPPMMLQSLSLLLIGGLMIVIVGGRLGKQTRENKPASPP
jgi:hypothetical protein